MEVMDKQIVWDVISIKVKHQSAIAQALGDGYEPFAVSSVPLFLFFGVQNLIWLRKSREQASFSKIPSDILKLKEDAANEAAKKVAETILNGKEQVEALKNDALKVVSKQDLKN